MTTDGRASRRGHASDIDNFRATLREAHLPFVLAVRPTLVGCAAAHRAGDLPQPGQRGGPVSPHQPQPPCWPQALRAIRSWLTPGPHAPALVDRLVHQAPPDELQELIDAVTAGQGICLYSPP